MQQLTAWQLSHAIILEGDVIHLRLPLPDSIADTHQWVTQLCALSNARLQDQEWGADRYQAHIYCGSFRLLLCIEWLCEAIWLERDAGETHSLDAIVKHLRHNVSSQNYQ